MVTLGFILSCFIGIFEAIGIDRYLLHPNASLIAETPSAFTSDQTLLLRISPVFSVVTGWIIFFLAMLICRNAFSQKLILLFIFGMIVGSIVCFILSDYVIRNAITHIRQIQPKIE